MSKLPFKQFLRRFGITLFFDADDSIVPGTVIEKVKKGYHAKGHLKSLINLPDTRWEHELRNANMVYGTVERTLSLSGKSKLNEFGVNISGGLGKATSVSFHITGVKARIFKDLDEFTLIPLTDRLRKNHPDKWALLNGHTVATKLYHATEVKYHFKCQGNVNLEAAISNKLHVAAGTKITWDTKKFFTITKNESVPFGFYGWKV